MCSNNINHWKFLVGDNGGVFCSSFAYVADDMLGVKERPKELSQQLTLFSNDPPFVLLSSGLI